MSEIDILLPAALTGCARQEPDFSALATQHAIYAEIAAQPLDASRRLLQCAGVAAFRHEAGLMPSALENVMAACAPETQTLPAHADADIVFRNIFSDVAPRLHALACLALSNKHMIVPHGALPAMLQQGSQHKSLRQHLLPVCGERGRWLARQNPSWSWAGGHDAGIRWENGTQEERLLWLSQALQHSPEKARQHLQADFPALPARERLALLEVFAATSPVHAADESWLESLLDDRAKEVRQLAAALLSRQASSAFAKRMEQRLSACLQRQKRFLRESLELTPPENFSGDWHRDTLEADKPAHEKMGERAWWLLQLTRLTPLSWWEEQTGLAPAKLLAWAQSGDWADVLLRGWHSALQRQSSPIWLEAWLSAKLPEHLLRDRDSLIAQLPLPSREKYWTDELAAAITKNQLSQWLSRLANATALTELLPAGRLGSELLTALENPGSSTERDYSLSYQLQELALLLPDSLLPRAANPVFQEKLAMRCQDSAVSRFNHLINLRQQLNAIFQETTP